MVLTEKLLDKLVCPQCKSKIEYKENKEQLICSHCRLIYRITDNIPVLLVDEAEKM